MDHAQLRMMTEGTCVIPRYYGFAILIDFIRCGMAVMRTRMRECHFNVTRASYLHVCRPCR
jgi:hypothetical protein